MSTRTRANKALGRFGALKPPSFRYKLVQLIGYLFWGRKLGYLSWWPHAGRSAGVIFTCNGRIVLGKRSAKLSDGCGKYSVIGGFVDSGETFAQGLVREVLEESGLVLDAALFNRPPDMMREMRICLREQYDFDQTAFYYVHALTPAQVAQLVPGAEVDQFILVDEAAYRTLIAEGQMAFRNEVSVIDEAFAKNLI